jgi:hypothetical protein
MKNRLFSISGVMVWVTLPLTVGLYYWEHTLQLTETGHTMVQVLLLPLVLGWAYFWNTQAEYYSLRLRLDNRTKEKKTQYHQVTALSFEASPVSNEPVSSAKSRHILQQEHPFEVTYHVPNH